MKHLSTLLVMLFFVLSAGFQACTDLDESYGTITQEAEQTQIPPASFENAVFHQGTESYMVPQKDPYTLANFQAAYDKLASGNSTQILTRAQADEFSDIGQLEATHYALRIFPRDEKEQWRIELMEDIKVSYTPFDYMHPSQGDVEKLSSATRSGIPVYPEETRYQVTYDDLETIEGPVDAETYTMPVLYAVWPCGKPLPDDMDYEIDYEVFLPPYNEEQTRNSTTLNANMLQILENEAIGIALGIPAHERATTRANEIRTLTGMARDHDPLTNDYWTPIANLKIRFQLGSKIWDTYTQSDGYFSITNTIPLEADCAMIFQHPKWKITTESSLTPQTSYPGIVSHVWRSSSMVYFSAAYSRPIWECHRAIDYYYHGHHDILQHAYEGAGIRIRAMSGTDPNVNGYFTYSTNNNAYISIYSRSNIAYAIGTVLHELGHFTHYGLIGGTGNLNKVNDLIRESYACYVGWYLGERYYSSLGYVNSNVWANITNQNWQMWINTQDNEYSPLFIDMVDDHDQSLFKIAYNTDPIENFPHYQINFIIGNPDCKNTVSLKTLFKEYASRDIVKRWYKINYTNAEMDLFFQRYLGWEAWN